MRRTGFTRRHRFRSTRQQSSKPGPLRGSWLFFVPRPLPRECSRGLGADAALECQAPSSDCIHPLELGNRSRFWRGHRGPAQRAACTLPRSLAPFLPPFLLPFLMTLGTMAPIFHSMSSRTGGLASDDDLDAAFPASFPEDPFPEALFADRPRDDSLLDDSPFDDDAFHDCDFHDGVPSSAAASGHTPGSFLGPGPLQRPRVGSSRQLTPPLTMQG